MSVLIFAELDEGKIKKSSQEAIFYGAKVAEMTGTSATAIIIGQADDSALSSAGRFGATKVLHDADARLNEPNGMAYATVVASAAEQEGSNVVVLAKSSLGDAMTARLAGKLKAGLAANVIELPDLSNGFRVKTSIYTGKAFAYNELKAVVKILAVRKNTIMPEEKDASAPVETFAPTLNDADFAVSVKNIEKSTGDILLPEADLVVSAGRGLKGPENWGIVEDLAHALHAATACSKPVSDLGLAASLRARGADRSEDQSEFVYCLWYIWCYTTFGRRKLLQSNCCYQQRCGCTFFQISRLRYRW